MYQKITIDLGKDQIFDTMKDVEDKICQDFFNGDHEVYDYWVSEMVSATLDYFISLLKAKYNIEIRVE